MELHLLLSDSEWSLLIELLLREQQQLRAEIRDTAGDTSRGPLKNRLATIEHMLELIAVPEAG